MFHCNITIWNGKKICTTFNVKFPFFSLIEIDFDDDDIECNEALLESAVLSATSSLNERGPENARLNGEPNDDEMFALH